MRNPISDKDWLITRTGVYPDAVIMGGGYRSKTVGSGFTLERRYYDDEDEISRSRGFRIVRNA